MFHLFDFVGKPTTSPENDELPTTQAAMSEEKLDELQLLEQAQSRLPAFCPHSSPFSTSCRSILSGFEWYAEEPLLGIDGSEPLLERPTVDFQATSTADHRTDLDQVLEPSDHPSATGEVLMHRLSAQHVENCHPINQVIAAADEDSPPFVVDTSTVSCPLIPSSSPTTASPLTDLPVDDDQALEHSGVPKPFSPEDDDMMMTLEETDQPEGAASIETVVGSAMVPTSALDLTLQDPIAEDCDSDSGSDEDDDEDERSLPRRSYGHDDDTSNEDDDAEEEPQLSPRLVDARALYEAYLQRRTETGGPDDWSTSSPGSRSGYGDEDDDDEDGYDSGVFIGFGGWQDQRALHRRNEDFPYHTYKPPLVGDSYQTSLPALLSEEQRLALAHAEEPLQEDSDEDDDGPRQEELMWSPDSVADATVEDYLMHVRELLDEDDFSEEKALVALHRHSYDVHDTLAALVVDPEPFHKQRWSDEEKVALVTGWSLYGKNWRKIQSMAPARSTGEIMQFYYQHKPRADMIRRQNQGVDDSESEESEEEEEPINTHLGAMSDSPLAHSEPSSPHRSPYQSDLAPVHMPMGEDESDREDHEVERRLTEGLKRRHWAAAAAGADEADDDDNNDDDNQIELRQSKKRRRETEYPLGEDVLDGADGEGNDKSEEDEERSAAARSKRLRLDRDDDRSNNSGELQEEEIDDVWSHEETTTTTSSEGMSGRLDTPASS